VKIDIKKDTAPTLRSLPQNVLYVVNGEKMPEGWKADELPGDSIGTIVVVKAAKALTFFGPRGVNGAVVIRTKAYEKAHPMMVIGDGKPRNSATLFSDSVLGRRPPLYVIDGHIWSNDSVQTLNQDEIESINVHKSGSEYTKQYGEQGKNGVIEITLKPKGAGAVQNGDSSLTIDGLPPVRGNGLPSVAVNGPDEKQLSVTGSLNNGHQTVTFSGEGVTVVADTIKMKNVIITGYHPSGN
jgi:hypothetical protein